MKDHALKPVLDRVGVSKSIDEHLREPISLLDDLVDYGTNLMARAFNSSPKDFKATFLLFVHLQQFIAHLDAAAALISQGSCLSANLQIRTLLENYLVTKWILASDTDNKIEHIFVANMRRRKEWQSIAIPGSAAATKKVDAANRIKATPAQRAEIAKEIALIDAMLAEPSRVGINAKFDKFHSERGYDPHWYQLCGARSIRKIADLVGREKDYDYIYNPFSAVTHGGDVWKSIVFRKDQVEVSRIRNAEQIPLLCRMAAAYAFEVFRLILNEYRFAELENFNRKYIGEWRERFRKVFNIDVKAQLSVI
jgi:hypothetical protein